MIQTTQRNSTRLRQDAVDHFFSSFGVALRASGCVSKPGKGALFYLYAQLDQCKEEKEYHVIHRMRKGERREKDWERWDETAWNGWNGMLGEMYVHKCSIHTLVGVDIQLLYFLLAHETSWSSWCRLGVASPTVNSALPAVRAMEYSFDFLFACVLALLNS